jgi:molybdenum ABC transporter molybdate-binding protein
MFPWAERREKGRCRLFGDGPLPAGRRDDDEAVADRNLSAVRHQQVSFLEIIHPAAVGDPDHVPAGIYARQSLISLGLWNGIRNRLARADNVRAALALVASGEAPLGIVYSTDAAISGDIRIAGRLPAESHRPITYPFALVRGQDTPAARQLLDWLTGPEAQKTYRAYGFITDGTE